MLELKRYHPYVITGFLFTFIIMNTLTSHPLFHVFIFIISWVYLFDLQEIAYGKQFLWNMLCIALAMCMNMLFQHRGIYHLTTIFSQPITLESITYGLDFGCMLAGVINLCKLYAELIHTSQILYMVTRISPNTAILLSLSIQSYHRLQAQYHTITFARGLLVTPVGIRAKIKENLAIVSMLLTWLMETGLTTSISMKSRGFQGKKRSSYIRYRLAKRDIYLLLCNLMIVLLYLYGINGIHFYWFPTFYQEWNPLQATVACMSILIYAIVPLLLKRKEVGVWEDIELTLNN